MNTTRDELEERLLGTALTTGYLPTVPLEGMWSPDGTPIFQLRQNIEMMLTHPMVTTALSYYESGIAGAEFWGGKDDLNPDNPQGNPISDSPEVSDFVTKHCERYWDKGVPVLQEGYKWGWDAGECLYRKEGDRLEWLGLNGFAPRDCFLLTQAHIPVGVRVNNIQGKGQQDLWLASESVPAKGLWYVHNPRYGQFYGRSQLYGAWRPWRRAAWKDGAEQVLDGGVYRFAYAGPEVGYPEEDLQGPPGIPNTTPDSQNRPRRYSRDIARQIAEQLKTGAGIGLPTTPYPKEQGGAPKWYVKWPDKAVNFDPILNYIKQLYDQISYGIGVPPELLQAAETGSGYSGRQIPMEAFLDSQQKLADAFLSLFVEQVLKPLVMWNFGPVKFTIHVKRLLETKNKAKQPLEQPMPTIGSFSMHQVNDRVRRLASLARRAA